MDSLPVHPFHRGIALPRHRIVFVPTPKTGCTTVLWRLALDVAGLEASRFGTATATEVTASLAIHSRRHWPRQYVPAPSDLYRMLRDGWSWITVVRDPHRRLWSAWQSKILLGEPYFVRRFAAEPWFPHQVRDAGDIRRAFQEFVGALGSSTPPHDFHWAPQWEYLRPDVIPYTHVGRTERLQSTLDLLLQLCGTDPTMVDGRVENRMPLPFDASLLDGPSRQTVQRLYGDDREQFSYPDDLPDGDLGAWTEKVEPLVPAINMIRERSMRLEDLQRRSAGLRRKLRRTQEELRRLTADE